MNKITPEMLLRNHIEFRNKKKSRRNIFIIIVISIMLFSLVAQYIFIIFGNKLEIKEYDVAYIGVPNLEINLSKSECKQLVEELYNCPHLYFEIGSKEDVTIGRSIYIPPIVFINKHITDREYIITYAHELTHIKYQTANETWVTFKTFQILYESNNEILHNCGLLLANWVVGGGYIETEYDCGYYILEYLKGEF